MLMHRPSIGTEHNLRIPPKAPVRKLDILEINRAKLGIERLPEPVDHLTPEREIERPSMPKPIALSIDQPPPIENRS